MMRFLFFLLFALLGTLVSNAQNRYTVNQYSTENGLPSNGIKKVCFDTTSGYLWIGTEAGIVRFNGNRFHVFNNQNTPEIFSDRMRFLQRGYDGSIYACDNAWHWFKIKNNVPTPIKRPNSTRIENDSCYISLYIDNPQIISNVLAYKHQSCTYQKFHRLSKYEYLYRFNSYELGYVSLQSPVATRIDSGIISLFKLKNTFYVLKHKGIYAYKPQDKSLNPVPLYTEAGTLFSFAQPTQMLVSESRNATFLFQDNFIWKLEWRDERIVAVLLSNKIPALTRFNYLDYDEKNDIICVGTHSKGILILKPKQVRAKKPINTVMGAPNAQYAQLVIDSNTILTNYGLLYGDSVPSHKLPVSLGVDFFINTFILRDSILVYIKPTTYTEFQSSLHIYHYRDKTTRVFPKIALRESYAACLHKDKLFICGQDGFGFIQADTLAILFPEPTTANVEFKIYDLREIQPGVFWAATSEGLIEYNIYKKSTRKVLYFPGIYVRSIQPIGKDYLIGTYGKGFFMYRNQQIRSLPLDKNNYLAFAHCFMLDRFGFLWISTNRGLFKVQYRDLQEAFDQGASSVYYHYFGQQDGMEMTEMNGGCSPCAVHLNRETISFPTMDGLLWVKPAETGKLLPEGKIIIEKVIADGISYNPDSLKQSTLASNTEIVDVYFDFPSWCNEENNYVEYRLNQDTVWRPFNTENNTFIRFQNLAGGKYHLEIRKRSGFGLKNFVYATIDFNIKTPFYFQVWFIVICILLLYSGILGIIHWRTKQLRLKQIMLEKQIHEKTKSLKAQNDILEKSNQINSRLISIISHDIITPLKFVAMGSKRLLDKHKPMPPELQEETITEITNTAQELQSLSTNILNWIKYQHKHRRQQGEDFAPAVVLKEVCKLLNPIASVKGIHLVDKINPDLHCHQFREPVKILLYNLLTNAIQFSTNSDILIEGFQQDDTLCLRVIDHGLGMSQDQIDNILSNEVIITSVNVDNKKGNGLGYLIIKDLLAVVRGKLAIESQKNKGTVVSITMPLNIHSKK